MVKRIPDKFALFVLWGKERFVVACEMKPRC